MERKKLFFYFFIPLFIFTSFFLWFKKPRSEVRFVEAKRGKIQEEILEVGIVKQGDPINLSFERSGKIKKIFVKEGEEVEEGTLLAKLEDEEARNLLERQKITLEIAQNLYEKTRLQYQFLERGDEKKEIYKAGLLLVTKPLDQGFFTLEELEKKLFNEDLEKGKSNIQYYAEYNSKFKDYPFKIEKKTELVKSVYEKIKTIKKEAEEDNEELLKLSYEFFSNISEIAKLAKETILFLKEIILEHDLTHEKQKLIDEHLLFFSRLESEFSALSKDLLKILNNLKTWEDKLKLLEMDLTLQELQLKEREKQLLEAKRNLEKHYLYSPIKGKISKINFKEGEKVEVLSPNFAFQIIPLSPFEIVVDIYEKEIPKVKEGNLVEIFFPAFEGQVFSGKVGSISEKEKIKDGVVYYEVKVIPESLSEKVFSGMTCDVKIITNQKEEVLLLPIEALKRKEGKYFVEVWEGKKRVEKEVEVGIWGQDFFEVLSGVSEGEKVIIP